MWGRASQITPYPFMGFCYKTMKTKRLKPYLLNIKVLSVNTGYKMI
ncbi:hypothetical protein MWE_1740 [Helicobacter pylori XZ274]|nr:hypothetical protein MWE_1740 [Helicobacter pylori XZ274]